MDDPTKCHFCGGVATNFDFRPASDYEMKYDLCNACKNAHQKAYNDLTQPTPQTDWRSRFEETNLINPLTGSMSESKVRDLISSERTRLLDEVAERVRKSNDLYCKRTGSEPPREYVALENFINDKQVLGGDPDNKPGEHYYDNLVIQRIISENLYVLEQEHQIQLAAQKQELIKRVEEMLEEEKIELKPSVESINSEGRIGLSYHFGEDVTDELLREVSMRNRFRADLKSKLQELSQGGKED